MVKVRLRLVLSAAVLSFAAWGCSSPTSDEPPLAPEVIGDWISNMDLSGFAAVLTAHFDENGSYILNGSMPDRSGNITGDWVFVPPAAIELRARTCLSDPPDDLAIQIVICGQVLNGSEPRPDTLVVDIDSAGVWHTEWLGNPIALQRTTP